MPEQQTETQNETKIRTSRATVLLNGSSGDKSETATAPKRNGFSNGSSNGLGTAVVDVNNNDDGMANLNGNGDDCSSPRVVPKKKVCQSLTGEENGGDQAKMNGHQRPALSCVGKSFR